ncbi:hypothetical protein ACGFK1_29985 [Mycobacterium sp. NPDC048908]|uniref:hypothetical protein n=1 Tax=Mycobacterium sp. NPDC048908 TaxID=3364292 RepID=UPI003711F9A8
MKNFAHYSRFAALPIVAAGIIGGAALGLAGTAGAETTDVHQPNTVAAPSVKAHPAPEAQPGWRWHHGVHHLADLQHGYTR